MSSLDELATLQDIDTHLDQLIHRRATLPERDQMKELDRAAAAIEARLSRVREGRQELARTQKRFEDEVASVEAKIAQENDKLYAGGITSPKEAQALQDEIASLERRKSALEDEELEIMEQAEPVDAELAVLDRQLAANRAEHVAATERLTVAEAEIDADMESTAGDRESQAANVPGELLTDYERRRSSWGGVVVGRLVGSTCSGCSLALPAVEVDRIKQLSPDDPVDCPECGVILVR